MRLKHVLRRLAKSPLFTSLTVLTLGLGIGSNAAIFSVIEGILLKPLPFHQPEQLIDINHNAPGLGLRSMAGAPFLYFTYRESNQAFQDVGIWRPNTVSVTGLAEPEEVQVLSVSDSVLALLGVQPALGRFFTREDGIANQPETVVLTYGYWRSKFGSDPNVIGRRLMTDGRAREIIGVTPENFRFLNQKPGLIVPLQFERATVRLGNFSYRLIARLKPGVTLTQASADIARMIPIGLRSFPPFPGTTVQAFEDWRLAPAPRLLKEQMVGDVGNVLWVLMGSIGVVLLIACANVANLLLVRADGRQQELAIRAALGASRGDIARAILMESFTLAAMGGALGLALAYAAVRLLARIAPANLPRVDEITIDLPVLLFTIAISWFAGLLFGSIPVFKYAGSRVAAAIRAGGRSLSQSRERHHARNLLVVAQVALALVLLISSALMIRTFSALRRVDPGFSNPQQVFTTRIFIPRTAAVDPVQITRMHQDILDRVAALPNVSSAALTSAIPMEGQSWHDPIYAEGREYSDSKMAPFRRYKFASPGLARTLGTRVISGREFTWAETYEAASIAMISENMARELWGSAQSAIGKRIKEGRSAPWREIVGVVADTRDDGVDQDAPSSVYFPILMRNFNGEELAPRRTLSYVIRTPRTGSAGFLNEVSQAIWSVNRNLPLASVRTLEELYEQSMARTSFTLVMLAVAGGMALILGVVGIYGVISYTVSQRTREIGIRMALGASRESVSRLIVGQGLQLALIGVACGLAAAAAVTRFMTKLLFGTSPLDPVTFATVSLGLTAAAVLASYLPARRAMRVDPSEALRSE